LFAAADVNGSTTDRLQAPNPQCVRILHPCGLANGEIRQVRPRLDRRCL